MSYILEALKKLEKERKRGRIPGLNEQDSVVYHSRKKPVWPYILIAVFSLNAALLIWWFLPSAKDKNPVIVTAPVVSQDVTRPEIRESENVTPPGAAGPFSVIQPPVSPPAEDAASHKSVQPVRSVPREEVRKTTGIVTNEPKAENETQKKAETSQQEITQEVTTEPLPDKKLYKLSELPSSIKEGLPGFLITAFLYSDSPSGRMARINERMMREGQVLEPGIRVEEIVTDGVILSYKKFRFFVSLK